MNILIDIGHPAHVHLFRQFAYKMQNSGHKVLFTCREKEHETYLLKKFGFAYTSFGKKFSSKAGKLFGLVKFDFLELLAGVRFKPDIFLSHGSFYAAHAASLLRKPHIALEDTGNMEQIRLYLPFSAAVLTPDVLPLDLGEKQIRYSGYHEMAYLHPEYFKPDERVIAEARQGGKEYAVLRLVAWNATHDKGQAGLTVDVKEKIIRFLAAGMRVIISSEGGLPAEYMKYRADFSPERMHDVLAGASIVVSEGATIASEAGVLGVPAVYINSQRISYTTDQEKYGTVYNFRDCNGLFEKVKEIIETPDRAKIWSDRRLKLLSDKIDVTSFMIWFVNNFPESMLTLKKEPGYQLRFK